MAEPKRDRDEPDCAEHPETVPGRTAHPGGRSRPRQTQWGISDFNSNSRLRSSDHKMARRVTATRSFILWLFGYFFNFMSTPPPAMVTSAPRLVEVTTTLTPFWFFIAVAEAPPAMVKPALPAL